MCELISAANEDVTKKYAEGVGVRANPRKVEDGPNLEAKFLQEVHNTSVRDHDGSVERAQRDTDLMIEDLTVQLDNALIKLNSVTVQLNLQRKFSNFMQSLWRHAEDELAKIKNTRWNRLKRWAKGQWEYDIYRTNDKKDWSGNAG